MSLPGRKINKSLQRKMREKAKSLEHMQKVNVKNDFKKGKSLSSIIEEVIKQTNEYINATNKSQTKLDNKRNEIQITSQQGDGINQRKIYECKGELFNWEIDKIEQKRKISGMKAKIVWGNGKDNIRIVVRAVLTENSSRYNEMDYFMELDSANIQLKLQQQKSIQRSINKVIEQQQSKAQDKQQISNWLKKFSNFQNLFMAMKLNERMRLKDIVQFKKAQINNRYILYPCPVSLTWSAHGLLCLSQNKVSNYFKPIFGSINSYRHLVEAPKFKGIQLKNNEDEDLRMIEQKKGEEEQAMDASFYRWDASEEVNFSVFINRGSEQKTNEEIFKSGKDISQQNQKPDKRSTTNHQTFYMGDTSSISPTVKKIYKRYFIGYCQNVQFQFHQKLKVFLVKNQMLEMEDGILYLINKIQKVNREGVMESLLQNQFAGYKNVLNHSDREKSSFFEKQKYDLVSEFLQEKIKNTPQSLHLLFTKSVMVENQFFRRALQNYFEESFKRLKITDNKCQCLGTYDNFDDINAQKILFKLLEQHLKAQKQRRDSAIKIKNKYKHKPEKYDDKEYKEKKYKRIEQVNQQMKLQLKGYAKKRSKHFPELMQGQSHQSLLNFSSLNFWQLTQNKKKQSIDQQIFQKQDKDVLNRNVNLNLMPFLVVNKVQFVPFQFNFILTQNQRESFLKTMIPILWIKDRSNQKFQYKLAKRVIIANSKIIKFLQIMNNIGNTWKRAEGKRNTFLKRIIDEYAQFKESSQSMIGKYYVACCQQCKGEFTAYSILEFSRVTLCSRCKYLQQMK